MTIGAHDLDLIKREVASVREYYQSRMDADIPPLKEELDRIATQLTKAQGRLAGWRKSGPSWPSFPAATARGWPLASMKGWMCWDVACIRSLLNAQLRDPSGLHPRMLEDWQSNIKAAMDSTTAGAGG